MLSLQIFLYKYYTCPHSIVIIFFLLPLPLKFLQHFSQPFVPMWNFICPSFSFTIPKKIAILSSIVHLFSYRRGLMTSFITHTEMWLEDAWFCAGKPELT